MTVIAAVAHEGHVYIGGDSAGVAGYNLTLRADPKVFAKDDMVFGFTTSFRMGDILRYSLDLPRRFPADDLDKYMRTDFINAVRRALGEAGWKETESGRDHGGNFLVGVAGRVFAVADDFQVGESHDPWAAVGCGAAYALGSLHATREADMPPMERIGRALEAAEHHSAGVRSPFNIVRTEEAA